MNAFERECVAIAHRDPRWNGDGKTLYRCVNCGVMQLYLSPENIPCCPPCYRWEDDADAPEVPLEPRPEKPGDALFDVGEKPPGWVDTSSLRKSSGAKKTAAPAAAVVPQAQTRAAPAKPPRLVTSSEFSLKPTEWTRLREDAFIAIDRTRANLRLETRSQAHTFVLDAPDCRRWAAFLLACAINLEAKGCKKPP